MATPSRGSWWFSAHLSAGAGKPFPWLLRQLITRRGLLSLAGALVCLNALAVLVPIQLVPDLGLRSAFSPTLKAAPRDNSFHPEPKGALRPRAGDWVVKLGDIDVETWPHLLRAPRQLQARLASLSGSLPPDWAKWDEDEEVF